MGACGAKPEGGGDAASNALNRRISMILKAEEKESEGVVKLLLLGTGNSGKSTVMKQIKLLFCNEFTDDERREVLLQMVQNIIVSLHIILEGVRDVLGDGGIGDFLQEMPDGDLGAEISAITKGSSTGEHKKRSVTSRLSIKKRNTLKLNATEEVFTAEEEREMDPANYPLVEALVAFLKSPPASLRQQVPLRIAIEHSGDEEKIVDNCEDLADDTPLYKAESMRLVDMLEKLWADKAVMNLYANHRGTVSSRLEADIQYMMENVQRMAVEGFLPSNDDLLRTRKRTVGAHSMNFEMDKDIKTGKGRPFRVTDVGGQRSERKRWVSHFDGIDALLFIVGLDGYNQVLTEDGKTNRLSEALEVFEDMVVCPFFTSTSFLLFLNKKDLLEEMMNSPTTRGIEFWDPDFTGPAHDFEAAKAHIQDRFVKSHSASVSVAAKKNAKLGMAPKVGGAPAEVYTHFTMATDTNQMGFVLDACKMIFLGAHLAETGMTLWDEDDDDGGE